MLPKALTIAGSDSGGGAGIQADLKTFQELDVFGMSAITAITAQNSQGVSGVYPVSPEGISQQITAVADDIGADAVKTGMLFDEPTIKIVAEKAAYYKWDHLVIDPVMVSTSGSKLLQDDAIHALKTQLFPLATIITPNIPEASEITGRSLTSFELRKEAAKAMYEMGAAAVLIKGGHHLDETKIVDIFYDGSTYVYLSVPRLDTRHTHGTGCTYAAAITAHLAKGRPLIDAVKEAKKFIHVAIKHGFAVGKGPGPTHHAAFRFYQEPLHELEVMTE
ncbi:bifunctional hydroxymethylpyrimidine kinase/phosphomethylpyrimidine kinase [Salipaludibacillus sp. LMS25]|jgi:hydroxymethylpyrimidine/phosphomethylpyrimidine kinase|uniref:bifunctional hydroxymethylpyrimidine kinase/phosphomethylpyrimidine kinase n=1 Tax=Salipaludibacillus sp. LMS25 TaxID=2924031 RepID=UPI0020D126B3|nr:bifunctional hydroxymethylpyrimidine kinase/phosphomethylpyrimidine kinase [Salipaludibacillus sp. LMS25]UTR13895.1 bifunctional hydroxymethylpyrimidine kinase/phosphomethylpyrimidine kinase [Salipaludibacillus sp. LMS25]